MKKAKLLSALGSRIRTVRLQKGVSQEALAYEAAFDRTYISLLERGRRNPSFANLHKLCGALGVTVAELTEGL
jgi:putative transcriptional regulator